MSKDELNIDYYHKEDIGLEELREEFPDAYDIESEGDYWLVFNDFESYEEYYN